MRHQRAGLTLVLLLTALVAGAWGGLASTATVVPTTRPPPILVPNAVGTGAVATGGPNGVCVTIGATAAHQGGDSSYSEPLPDWDETSDPIVSGEFRPLTQGYAVLAFGTVPDVTSVRITERSGRVTTVRMTPATGMPMNVAVVTFRTQHLAGTTLDGQSAKGSFHCDVDDQSEDNILSCTSERPVPPPTS